MAKTLTLAFIVLLGLAALTSYIVLTEKIAAGNEKIVAGQKQLKEGQELLTKGKAKLANGQQQLSPANTIYDGFKAIPFVGLASKLPVTGQIIGVASAPIREGNRMVAQGNQKIQNGERQLAAGKVEIERGLQRLTTANIIRKTCGYSAVFLFMLAIGLAFLWRPARRRGGKA